ncbi:MAG TPA: hypothetical protein V6D17_11400 [Candidatus Obscuribacterales bacterium]
MRKTSIWIAVLTLGYVLPVVQLQLIGGLLPGTSIYLAHFLDLAVNAPFFLIVLLSLFLAVRKESTSNTRTGRALLWLAALFLLFFFEGHGIHFAANSVSSLINHDSGPPELLELTYFYDEILGHYMLMFGQAGLLYVLMLYEAAAENAKPCSRLESVLIILCGLVAGITVALILLEGQFAILGVVSFVAVWATAVATGVHRGWFNKRPFAMYMAAMTLTTVAGLILWAWRYKALVEPLARPFRMWMGG